MDDVIKNESMLRAENLTILNKLKNMPALKRKLFRDNVLKTYEFAKFFSEFSNFGLSNDDIQYFETFRRVMFCLMFLVILFDSLIFLLRYADQRNFVMYIIMPKIILAQS